MCFCKENEICFKKKVPKHDVLKKREPEETSRKEEERGDRERGAGPGRETREERERTLCMQSGAVQYRRHVPWHTHREEKKENPGRPQELKRRSSQNLGKTAPKRKEQTEVP